MRKTVLEPVAMYVRKKLPINRRDKLLLNGWGGENFLGSFMDEQLCKGSGES
jgi:hypothetical protein